MCSIFGFVNYGNKVNGHQLKELVRALSIEAEARGKDATGIAYVKNGELVIYKKAEPAHKMKFYFPSDTKILTGHTRMTTQGSPKHNFNNHPFSGKTKDGYFALCHNGVICNDHLLEEYEQLPKSFIETDSYVAVKLLEKYGSLNFQSIAKMSEIVYGTFVFTMLNQDNTLYISKGENPLCLLHFKKLGLYVYVGYSQFVVGFPKVPSRRPPPLTEPERNAVWSVPTVTNSRTATVGSPSVSHCSISFRTCQGQAALRRWLVFCLRFGI